MKKLILIVFLFIGFISYGQITTIHNTEVKITQLPIITEAGAGLDSLVFYGNDQKLKMVHWSEMISKVENDIGGGNIGGSITNNQIAVGSAIANEIEGNSGLTYDGTTLLTNGTFQFDSSEIISWDDDFKTISIPTGTGSTLQVGQEFYFLVYNNTGSTITNGSVIKPTGGFLVGSEVIPTVILAKADHYSTCEGTMFIATSDIANGAVGMGTKIGRASGIDLSGFNLGDDLFLSATTAGAKTNVQPEFPNYIISLGGVLDNSVSGVMAVSFTTDVEGTVNSAWDGSIREGFDFTVSSNGTVITGSLEQKGTGDLTMMFSDGMATLDCTPQATITLTAGTDTNPQINYVYIPNSTKVLTSSTSGWGTGESIKVANVSLRSASATQTDDALVNRNWNDHVKSTDNNGHLLHITERLRHSPAIHETGTEATLTIVGASTPDDVYVSVTGGKIYQLHIQDFPAIDMNAGGHAHIVNDFTTPYESITNLNSETFDALGNDLNNTSFSFVLWGVNNKTGETNHLMINKPIGSYAYASPQDAIEDSNNYSVYIIPPEFRGAGFLIARFTFTYKNDVWTIEATEDLRGRYPNVSAGGGSTGGGGATTFLGLTDTPSGYTGEAGSLSFVNAGETALDFDNNLTWDGSTLDINGRLEVTLDPINNDGVGNVSYNAGIYTQTVDLDPIALNSNDHIPISSDYTTLLADDTKKLLMTGGNVILDDAVGITAEYGIYILNRKGTDITFTLSAGQSTDQWGTGAIPNLADGYYAYLELVADDVWSVIIGQESESPLIFTAPLSESAGIVSLDETNIANLDATQTFTGFNTFNQVATIFGSTAFTSSFIGFNYTGKTGTTAIGVDDNTQFVWQWEDVNILEGSDTQISFPALSDSEIDTKGATSAITKGYVDNNYGQLTAAQTWSGLNTFSNVVTTFGSSGASSAYNLFEYTGKTGSTLFGVISDRMIMQYEDNDEFSLNGTYARFPSLTIAEIDETSTANDKSVVTKEWTKDKFNEKDVLDNIKETTASRTIATTDMGNIIYCQSASATTISIPDTWALIRGTTFTVVMENTGQVTLDPTGTTTLNGSTDSILIDGQWGVVQFIHLNDNTDDWHVFGKIQ